MNQHLVDVTATIPAANMAEYYEFVASLHKDASKVANGDASSQKLSRTEVLRAYHGGKDNQPWKDILLELSKHPGEEVFWPDLCEKVGLDRRTASGVIGAGERRCKGKVPYTKRYAGDDTWFLMSEPVAKWIHEAMFIVQEDSVDE